MIALAAVLGVLAGLGISWLVLWRRVPALVRGAIGDQLAYEQARAVSFYPDFCGVPYDFATHQRAIEERVRARLGVYK